MKGSKTTVAFAAMVLACALWGFSGWFCRTFTAEGFSSMQVTFDRNFVTLAVMTVLFLVMDRDCFRIRPKDLWLFVFFGIFKTLSDMFLFKAQVMIPLSISTLLQMMSPYWALILSVFLFSEKVTARKVTAMMIAFVGCILVSGALSEGGGLDTLGLTFGIFCGISYAVYCVGTKMSINKGYSTNTCMFYMFLFSTVTCLPFADLGNFASNVEGPTTVMYLLAFGILVTLIPYFLQTYAMNYITVVQSQVLGLLEVVFAFFVGLFLFSETPDFFKAVGLILIPVSIIYMNLSRSDREPAPEAQQ